MPDLTESYTWLVKNKGREEVEINNETEILENDVRNLLSHHMKMDNRSVDANMKVNKSSRKNSTRVTFSDVRFKCFIFSACKQPHLNHTQLVKDCTSINIWRYTITIYWKPWKKREKRLNTNVQNFDTVYSFDGQIYVNKGRVDDRTSAIPMSKRKSLERFLNQLCESNPSRSLNSTGFPF